MAIIDADAHVLETDTDLGATWANRTSAISPTCVIEPATGGKRAFWIIDGTVHVARRQGGGAVALPRRVHGDKVSLPETRRCCSTSRARSPYGRARNRHPSPLPDAVHLALHR